MQRFRLILASALTIIILVVPPLLSVYSNRYVEWVLGILCVGLVAVTSAAQPWSWLRGRPAEHAPVQEWVDVDLDEDALTGVWGGTLRIWPAGSTASLRLWPIRIRIEDGVSEVAVIPAGRGAGGGYITRVLLLEHDTARGNVDLRIEINVGGRRELHRVALCRQDGRLISEDETATVTLELRPQAPLKQTRKVADETLADVA